MATCLRLACIGLATCACLWLVRPEARADDKNKPPGYLPQKLTFQIGSLARREWVEWDGKALRYKVTGLDVDQKQSKTKAVTPSEAQWKKFWASVDGAKAWKWSTRYENEAVQGGTSWGLQMEHGEKKLKSSGRNAYPNDEDVTKGTQEPTPSKAFRQFRKGIEALLGFELGS